MTADTYFHRLNARTATRMWINNPTEAEARAAIAQGAISCTSNPTYAARMLQVDRPAALAAIDAALRESGDDAVVADLVQGRLLRPDGQCGIVVPSGIYTDMGATGLRKPETAPAIRRSRMIWLIGATPFGQASMQLKQCVQS